MRIGCFNIVSRLQREENDKNDEAEDGENKNATFGAGYPTAEDGLTNGVRGEEMVLDHQSTVGDAIEE